MYSLLLCPLDTVTHTPVTTARIDPVINRLETKTIVTMVPQATLIPNDIAVNARILNPTAAEPTIIIVIITTVIRRIIDHVITTIITGTTNQSLFLDTPVSLRSISATATVLGQMTDQLDQEDRNTPLDQVTLHTLLPLVTPINHKRTRNLPVPLPITLRPRPNLQVRHHVTTLADPTPKGDPD